MQYTQPVQPSDPVEPPSWYVKALMVLIALGTIATITLSFM